MADPRLEDDPEFAALSPDDQAWVRLELAKEMGVAQAEAGAVARSRAAEKAAADAALMAVEPRLGASSAAVDRNPELMGGAVALPSAYLLARAAIPTTKAAAMGALTGFGAAEAVKRGAGAAGLPKGVTRALSIGAGLVGGVAGTTASGRAAVGRLLTSPFRSAGRAFGEGVRAGKADVVRSAAARRAMAAATPAVPAAAAPVAAEAAPAALSQTEARAQLEALLSKAVSEGRLAAATKEAAKGNRQLAEKILGELQGEGVIAP